MQSRHKRVRSASRHPTVQLAVAHLIFAWADKYQWSFDNRWLYKELRGLLRHWSRTSTQTSRRELQFYHGLITQVYQANATTVARMSDEKQFQLRHAHSLLLTWLARQHAVRVDLRRALMQRAAFDLGLWPSEWQWPVVYHKLLGFHAVPLYTMSTIRGRWPSLADAILWLQGTILSVFRSEYQSATALRSLEEEHPEGLHVSGKWRVSYLMEDANSCKRDVFPGSCASLATFDRKIRIANQGFVQAARFASLHPGTKVIPHTSVTNQRLKIHCGLSNPDKVNLSIANTSYTWEPGVCVLIDDSFEHEIVSGPRDRVRTILEIKLQHPDLEASGMFLDEESGQSISLSRTLPEVNGEVSSTSSSFSKWHLCSENCQGCDLLGAVYMLQMAVAGDPYNPHAWYCLGTLLTRVEEHRKSSVCLAVAWRLWNQSKKVTSMHRSVPYTFLPANAADEEGSADMESDLWHSSGQHLANLLDAIFQGPGGRSLLGRDALARVVRHLLPDEMSGESGSDTAKSSLVLSML